jgi:Family of unknown function (DUF5908)
MPIQIRELIITATVEENKGASQMPMSAHTKAEKEAQSREDLVQECVDQVLRILKQQGRR